MSKGLLKIRIFPQLFYYRCLQREANRVRRTKRNSVILCLKDLANSQGKGTRKGLTQWLLGRATGDSCFVVRVWKDVSKLSRNIPRSSLHIVSAVIVSNRKLSKVQWFMCRKSNDCFNSLTLVSDCRWVLHYIICCVKLAASVTRSEDTNHLADWIAESANPHNLNVKFRVLFVRNPITG